MAYATQDDIVTIYSENALYVAERDGDGVIDAAAVERALDAASGEIDSYLGVRYALPLTAPTSLLTQYCVDIALYRLAHSRDVLSEEHRTRYEDAIKWLKDVSAGRASLNLPGPTDPETGEAQPTPNPKPIVAGGPERIFTREQMREL